MITTAIDSVRRLLPVAGLFVGALLWLPSTALASPIDGFGIGDGALISVQSLLVAYDTDSNSLYIVDLNGDATIDDDEFATPLSVDGTGLNIILSVDGTGVEGSFELEGTVDELGFMSGMLLTAEAIGFGFYENGEERGGVSDELQLLFSVTGGDAMGLFNSVIAISVTGTGFPGDFDYDFVNDGSAQALVGNSAVPLPGAVWLLGSALLALGSRRRLRNA